MPCSDFFSGGWLEPSSSAGSGSSARGEPGRAVELRFAAEAGGVEADDRVVVVSAAGRPDDVNATTAAVQRPRRKEDFIIGRA